MDRWTGEWPLSQPSCKSGSQDQPECPWGINRPTSEHPGAAGAGRSWGPAALCQGVAADDQLQHVTRLGQEWHRQAAVEVPRANVIDLHGAQPRGQPGLG